jgi:peptidyl-prolyl cis-trans isomerase SurA|tara:strand:- start:13869 stop:15224 length:1356 start_codon:yes stop_codon:yes gene_type:complete
MKYIISIIGIILFCTSSFAKILDQAIVIIEDDVITQNEYQQKLKFVMNNYRINNQPIPNDLEAFRKQVLDHMINTRLQINYARRNGLEVKEWMIDNAMEDMAQKNKVTLSEYRESLINKGIDYNAYRDVIKEEIITRQVQRRVVSEKIKVSKKEIEDFIKHQSHVFKENNKYKISNILISLTETPSISEKNEAVKKIKMIKNKFSNGESFSSLAKNYSDSGNAMTGGDLGWRKLSEIPKIFLKELETLKKGSVSEIIETLNGYYICYLEDKKEITNINIQEVKARHVLIKRTAIVSDKEAKEKLIELKIRIENGESFSDVARAHSDDTMSAASGGILEWTNPGSFVPAFEDKVTSLPLNKISEPFTTQFGWHILEVLGRRDQDNTEIIMQNLARQYITSSRTREVIDAWFIELKEQNFIKYVSENNKKNQRNINLKKRDLKNTNSWDPFSE